MLVSFNEFLNEARGFSSIAAEYAELCKFEIMQEINRYRGFKFKKSLTNYSNDILIEDAFLQVSEEAAREFPIDNIKIIFRVSAVSQKDFLPYSAWYTRNYDKVKLKKGEGQNIDITIMCKLIVPKTGEGVSFKLIEKYVDEILHHEIMHAYNDYRDPGFYNKYRLGQVMHYAKRSYPKIMESAHLSHFLYFLYALTDEELIAISGEKEKFNNLEELEKYDGYLLAKSATSFDPEEYTTGILADFEKSEYREYLITRFGEFFLDLYRSSVAPEEAQIDPKILKISPEASVGEVVRFFTPYIRTRGEKLLRKIVSKLTQQGEGKLI